MTVQKCTSRNCSFAVTGLSPGHCCKVCHLTPGHHGPFCKKHVYQLEVAKERVEHKQEALSDKQRGEREELERRQAAEQSRMDMQRAAIDVRIEQTSHNPHAAHGHHQPHHHHQPSKCYGCTFAVTGVNPTHCCNACNANPGNHGPACRRESVKCSAHGCHFALTGVNATHCCNKCSNHPGQHGPACKQQMAQQQQQHHHHHHHHHQHGHAHVGFNLSGAWKNAAGHDVTMIQQVGNQFTATNPSQGWSPSVGTLSGFAVSFQTGGLMAAGLTGSLQGDGRVITFSNGCSWVRQ